MQDHGDRRVVRRDRRRVSGFGVSALRDDASALALRGIAIAEIGDAYRRH